MSSLVDNTYIYCLLDPNGNVRYVGKSDNPKRRLKEHLRHSKNKETYKDNWICSLSTKSQVPELFILDYVPYTEFVFWEDFYMILFKSWGFKLTNTSCSIDNGDHFNLERNKKISEKLKGRIITPEHREKLKMARLGAKASDITRLKFSELRKGEKNPMFGVKRNNSWDENKRKKILQLSLLGEVISEWDSVILAANSTNTNRSSINYVLSNKRNSAGGYKWEYKNA